MIVRSIVVILALLPTTVEAFPTLYDKINRFRLSQSVVGTKNRDEIIVSSYTSRRSSSTPISSSTCINAKTKSSGDEDFHSQHTLAILTMPSTSMDRIANEAILETAVEHASKLSVVLRCEGTTPSLSSLRRYVGEVYSTLWDVAMSRGDANLMDVVVYPANLPNAAPEQWLNHLPDLDCVCSHDSICGWVSESAQGRGLQFLDIEDCGIGGLDAHVDALNADRAQRNLKPITALHVDPWPMGASYAVDDNVSFLDDDTVGESNNNDFSSSSINGGTGTGFVDEEDDDLDNNMSSMIGGARISSKSLFDNVAVGGTFDGMHYGHRKLLTLAVSSVNPISGKLLIGVTVDEMLKHKKYSEYIPSLKERMNGARDFVYRLAPGMKNRIILEPILDPFGPPGSKDDGEMFDALVLSHETLENGVELNKYRQDVLGFKPLTLLCTRRTEAYGMSSTALRRLRRDHLQATQAGS